MRHLTFEEIVAINRNATHRSGEAHFYEAKDEKNLRAVLNRIRLIGGRLSGKEVVVKKAAYLMHSIASMQPFHEGNKRTAYIAC